MFTWRKSLLGSDVRTIAYSPLDGRETFIVKYEDRKLSRRIGPDEWQTITYTPDWDADTAALDYVLTECGYTPGDASNL